VPEPTAEETATEQALPEPSPTLSADTPARYGSVELSTGFEDDETPPGFPHQVFVWSGGPIDVSYLGAGCTGFASANPDYTVSYFSLPGSMGADLLRFYTGGPALVIRFVERGTDDARWFCSDQSPQPEAAAFDFHDPKSGRYDVWIASRVAGERNPGFLNVTEQSDWY